MEREKQQGLTDKREAHHGQGNGLHGNKSDTQIHELVVTQNTTADGSAADHQEAIFNVEGLGREGAVFLVNDRKSALAVMEGGGQAVGLGSVENIPRLINAAVKSKRERPLLLSFDKNIAGSRALAELTAGFFDKEVAFKPHDLYAGYKTVTETAQKDPATFEGKIQEGQALVEIWEHELRKARRDEYQKTSAGAQIDAFREYIENMKPATPTGFNQLDEAIGGGLRAALYMIGASPGAGKTTFIVQMADYLAKHQDRDILFFSLEMSRFELMAKSISRYTYENAGIEKSILRQTALNIMDRPRVKYNPGKDKIMETENLIDEAFQDYADWGKRLYIIQGSGDIATDSRNANPTKDLTAQRGIRDIINEHIRITGNSPVVIIDYLQIIQAHNRYWSAKENMDYISSELKRISRDCNTPVIVVTSYNRDGYEKGGMAAVKESGGIEYAVDVLIGLNHIERKLNPQIIEKGKNKEVVFKLQKQDGNIHTEPRKIELEIYKNRHGRLGGKIKLNYYSAFNYFEELDPGTDYPDEVEVREMENWLKNGSGAPSQEIPGKKVERRTL